MLRGPFFDRLVPVKIIDLEIFRYSLPLAQALELAGEFQREREGFLIFIKGDDHTTGVGEVAPLIGFSDERLQDVQKQLFFLRDKVRGNSIPDDVESLTWRFEAWLRTWKLFPSVRCAFETAVLDLLARRHDVSLDRSINPASTGQVPRSELLSQKTQKLLQKEVAQAVQAGCRSFKLKVGDPDIKADHQKVSWVLGVLPPDGRLHLDANRRWRYGQAFNFVREFEPRAIEYLEEPIDDSDALDEFSRITKFPFALDETLRECTEDQLEGLDNLKMLVLKPMLLGGWEKTMGWVRWAHDRGIRAAISSTFESSVGLLALAHLACAVTPDEPAGLDTGKWYSQNLLDEPFEPDGGLIIPGPYALEKSDLDFKLIRPVKDA